MNAFPFSIQELDGLTKEALEMGATGAAIIKTQEIIVKDELAELCRGEYKCPNYGTAGSCPPNIEGPEGFRRWQKESRYSIVVKIELPSSVMFSDERKGVMQLLHQIVSAVEQKAVSMGLKNSRAFAGSSCKTLFCADKDHCAVVHSNAPCRNPEIARPSMSGFGIDVTRLMESACWPNTKTDPTDGDQMSWVAGLILLA